MATRATAPAPRAFLPSDLLLKISEPAAKPARTRHRLPQLHKRMHDLIPGLRQTAFVAKLLIQTVTLAKYKDRIKLVIDECAIKMQAAREFEDVARIPKAISSTELEKAILTDIRTDMKLKIHPR